MKSFPDVTRFIAFSFILFLLSVAVLAQNHITSRIVDDTQAPVAGAIITVQSLTGAELDGRNAHDDYNQ